MKPAGFKWVLQVKGFEKVIQNEIKSFAFVLDAKDVGFFTEQVEHTVNVELDRQVKSDYHRCFRDWLVEAKKTKYITVRDIWLAMLACGYYPSEMKKLDRPTKPEEVCRLLKEDTQTRAVVFARWTRDVVDTASYLDCPYIVGSTPYEKRKLLIEALRKGSIDHLVAQSKTVMKGLDLSCVDVAVVTSHDWAYEVRYQLQHRLKHPLKTQPTFWIDMVARDTIEEKVVKVLRQKHEANVTFLDSLKVAYGLCAIS